MEIKMWYMTMTAKFDYNPRTFMWKVSLTDKTNSEKVIVQKHWLLPVAYAMAVGEYYGYFKSKV